MSRLGPFSRAATRRVAFVVVSMLAAVVVLVGGAENGAANRIGDFSGFTVSVASPQTAGNQFTVTIQALDADHDGDANYSGTKCVRFSGPATSPNGTAPSYPAAGSCGAGNSSLSFSSSFKATATVTLYAAQNGAKLTVTDVPTSKSGTSSSFNVNPGAAHSFVVPTPASQTAGVAFGETLTALDTWGNTATGYIGSQTINFSGPSSSPNNTAPTYPASVSFSLGVGTVNPITLFKAQSTTLTATQGSVTGASGSFTVNPGSAHSFVVPTPGTQTAGVLFAEILTALDTWGNTATGYTGSQTIAFSGPASSPNHTVPTYPASVTFTLGVGTATPITLTDAQTTTLTATQQGTTIAGTSGSFTVNPGTLLPAFVAQPGDAQVSTTIFSDPVAKTPVTVGVADQFGNLAPDGTTVTMTLPATLSGTKAQPTTGGVASFNDLSLGAIGTYQLTAQVGSQNALSNPFDVVVQLAVCNTGSCQVSASNAAQSSSSTINSGTGAAFQGLVLTTTFVGTPPPSGVCGGFTSLTGTTGTAVEASGGNIGTSQPNFTITFTIPKATIQAAGLSYLQALTLNVCLGAKRFDGLTDPGHAWTGKFGVPATYDPGTGFYWGLVGDWPFFWLPNPNPHIAARYIDSQGNVVIVLIKPYPWDGWAYI